jgi:hypothetical protein
MNKLNDFEADLILKEVSQYLGRPNTRSLAFANKLTWSCLEFKLFEVTKLSLKEPTKEVYEARLKDLTEGRAKFFVKELTISGCWDNSWAQYLTNFHRLNTLKLCDLEVDASILNGLKVNNLCLDNVKVANITEDFSLNASSLIVGGSDLSILKYLTTSNEYNQLILTKDSDQDFINSGIVIKSTKKCLTLPTLNQLKTLSFHPISSLKITGINLEITKLTELIGTWPKTLASLEITKSILFPPSRITPNNMTNSCLTGISLNEVDFRGFNYLEYLIKRSNLHLNLKDSELDKFNVSAFNYNLIVI